MDKIWLKRYPENVPHEINTPKHKTLVEMFERSVRKFADQPAFINMGTTMTYRKLEERSRAFAAYLQNDLKLKKGDRVAFMMPNQLQYPIAFFGALRAGMIVVNVNPLYTPREIEHQLNDADVSAIVITSNFARNLQTALPNTPVKHVILTSVGQMLPRVKGATIDFVIKYIKRMIPKYSLPNAISFRKVLREGKKRQYIKPMLTAGDTALLQYTGGTTGIAKGAVISHGNLVANVQQAKDAYGSILREGEETIVTALPLYHIFALTINALLFLDIGGRNLLITNPRDIEGLIKELHNYKFTAITGVNTLFNALVNHEDFKELDFSHLRFSVGGGMAVQRTVADKWMTITKCYLLEGYGLTECSPMVSVYPSDLKVYNGSIGLPLPSTDARVVDEEGKELPIGECGELQVRGPQVMQGYWKRPSATREILSEDGWLATGDIVRFDEDGFIYIVDRKKDMILVSGFNVFPNEIEEQVASHEKVLEVAAIGQPSESSGEIVKIYVVKKDPSLTKEELITYCREQLTGYKIPKIVEFRDELPKSNVGKILRRELRDENIANLMNVEPKE